MLDWIIGAIGSGGAIVVALLMFGENVFPPIPSELIMPLAGFNAARGELGLTLVIVAGSAGSLAGAALWYWIGLRIGADRLKRWARRHGRWLTLTPDDIDGATAWFERYGGPAVLIGRLVPGVRTFISVPAGIARMNLWLFLAYSTVGTIAWTAALTLAGYYLEDQYDKVSAWLNPVSTVVIVGLVLWYLYLIVTFDRRLKADDDA